MEEEEEFQEADIVFPEPDNGRIATDIPLGGQRRRTTKRRRRAKASQRRKKSAPIDVPLMRAEDVVDDDGGEGGESSMSSERSPPHVLVGRRAEEGMVCSVCTGYGRTLKGRDLLRVRNYVLRMTGFYEE